MTCSNWHKNSISFCWVVLYRINYIFCLKFKLIWDDICCDLATVKFTFSEIISFWLVKLVTDIFDVKKSYAAETRNILSYIILNVRLCYNIQKLNATPFFGYSFFWLWVQVTIFWVPISFYINGCGNNWFFLWIKSKRWIMSFYFFWLFLFCF